jgi:hypothetical protein
LTFAERFGEAERATTSRKVVLGSPVGAASSRSSLYPTKAAKVAVRQADPAKPKPKIYSTVSQEGTLVFSDTPIPKVVKD